jgi:CubicO group peptidase (beta-lactamase class C family)
MTRSVLLAAVAIALGVARAAVTGIVMAGVAVTGAAAQDAPSGYIAKIENPQIPDRQGFDSFTVEGLMRRFRVPGMSIAVIKDFRIHWGKGYGVADVETGAKVDERTLFQAASISKPVTAMAFMAAVRDGKASLDADINTMLRSWKIPRSAATTDAPVTARSLLSHTSGSGDGFGFPGYEPAQSRPTPAQIFEGQAPSNVGRVPFVRRPYAGYQYSGGGTTIVQLALEESLGKPFAALMRELVLGPLGMEGSGSEQPPTADREARTARAHGGGGQAMNVKWHVYPEQAAAGLWTSPSELAQVVIEVQRALSGQPGRVLTPVLAKEMVTPIGTGPFAVGFSIDKRGEGWSFSHGGANWGFGADLIGHFRHGYGVVIMTNGDNGGALISEVEARVAAAYGWDNVVKAIPR